MNFNWCSGSPKVDVMTTLKIHLLPCFVAATFPLHSIHGAMKLDESSVENFKMEFLKLLWDRRDVKS